MKVYVYFSVNESYTFRQHSNFQCTYRNSENLNCSINSVTNFSFAPYKLNTSIWVSCMPREISVLIGCHFRDIQKGKTTRRLNCKLSTLNRLLAFNFDNKPSKLVENQPRVKILSRLIVRTEIHGMDVNYKEYTTGVCLIKDGR